MATKKKSAKKSSGALAAVEIGAGLLAAAAAGGYYFYGTKNAKKHRHAASSWAKGLKRDVVRRAKSLKKIDAKTLAKVVDQAASAYQGARGVASMDVKHAAAELKKNWAMVARELAPSAKVKKTAKKAVKKVKKVVKKATKSAKNKR